TYKALTANVTVQQRSLDLAQDLVRQNQARVRGGDAPPLDLVQAQAVQIGTYKALTANVTVQQRSLDRAQDLVRQNQARVRVGDAPPLDLVQAQAEEIG